MAIARAVAFEPWRVFDLAPGAQQSSRVCCFALEK